MTDERTAVAAFLRKCNEYAKASIERKQAVVNSTRFRDGRPTSNSTNTPSKKLPTAPLDRWFQPTTSHQPPLLRLDVNAMEHVERSTWLNSVLSPRPVVVAGSLDDAGNEISTAFFGHAGLHRTAVPDRLVFHPQRQAAPGHPPQPANHRKSHAQHDAATPRRRAFIVDETATPLPKGGRGGPARPANR